MKFRVGVSVAVLLLLTLCYLLFASGTTSGTTSTPVDSHQSVPADDNQGIQIR